MCRFFNVSWIAVVFQLKINSHLLGLLSMMTGPVPGVAGGGRGAGWAGGAVGRAGGGAAGRAGGRNPGQLTCPPAAIT